MRIVFCWAGEGRWETEDARVEEFQGFVTPQEGGWLQVERSGCGFVEWVHGCQLEWVRVYPGEDLE